MVFFFFYIVNYLTYIVLFFLLNISYDFLFTLVTWQHWFSLRRYREVWVSGWGALRAESMAGQTNGCATTPFGPQKFKRCANFREKGGKVHCKKAVPPPEHKECARFLEHVDKDNPVVRQTG